MMMASANDSDEAIDCLNRCHEQLQLSDLHDSVNSGLVSEAGGHFHDH